MNTKISNAIEAMVYGFLKEQPDKVLCISINAQVSYICNKITHPSADRGIHIAIYAPSNYVKVVMAINNDIAFRFDKTKDFKFKSDHDSCWRSDGLSSPLSGVANDMVDELQSKGAKSLPWNQYSWFCNITEAKLIPGKIEVDRNNDYKVTLKLE